MSIFHGVDISKCPKTSPPPPDPLGVKNVFGRFLASISAQIWRNITKIAKNADFKKTGPPAGPAYCPPCPPWGSKKFLGGFWHLVSSNPSHLAQKISQNHQFWSNRCMTKEFCSNLVFCFNLGLLSLSFSSGRSAGLSWSAYSADSLCNNGDSRAEISAPPSSQDTHSSQGPLHLFKLKSWDMLW